LGLIDTLSNGHEPLFICDRLGVVRSLNRTARAAAEQKRGLFLGSDGRLRFQSPAAVARLDALLADLSDPSALEMMSSTLRFAVAGEPDPNTVVVSRIREAAEFKTNGNFALVVHYRLEAFQTAPDNLCEIFELTPAEELVAKAIIQGKALKLCAQTLGNSIETIRWHAKNVLTKAGCSSQAEFVSLAFSMTRAGG
jgi:DNA-binding CsgD family transcriptional regulator